MTVAPKYERYSKEELIRIIEERDEIDDDRSMNRDFLALMNLVA
jgi:hypothetical protein